MKRGNLRRGNRPILDEKGYATGILKSVIADVGIKEERKGRDIEEIEYQRYVFSFDVKGIVDNIEMKVITGTVINDEPPHIIAKGRGVKKEKAVYNRLTTACIGLNLVNEKELSTIDDKKLSEIEQCLDVIKDIPTTFKIVRNEKTGFLNIDPTTIQILEKTVKTPKV